MRHPPPLKTEGGNGGESQFIIHTYACYCVTVSSCSTPKFYSLKFCLKRECYHQTRSHSLWGYFQSHLRFYYRFVAVKDSAREGVLAKCDRNNRHQQLLRIVHNKRAYMFIPYRSTMDAGCGSATVLMLLQVLLSSCYGMEALIRSTTVNFRIRG